METPQDVLIAGPRHLIIHGQFGNMQAKIGELRAALESADEPRFLPYLEDIDRELEYLREAYPQLDGSTASHFPRPKAEPEEAGPTQKKIWDGRLVVRHKLRDMRLLLDAAYLSYMQDGAIACHFKIMLDEAWRAAADEVGYIDLDDIPL